MRPTRRMILIAGAAAWSPSTVFAQATRPPTRDGVLRVALLGSNPAQAITDPRTGALKGVAIDLAEEMARRTQARLEVTSLPTVQAVTDALVEQKADVGFLASHASREGPIRFSNTYLRNPQSVIIRQTSQITSLGDLERHKARLGVTRGDSIGLFIGRNMPGVTLVPIEGAELGPIAALLAQGDVEGFAASRLRLEEILRAAPGFRLLPGSLYGVPQAFAVRAGDTQELAWINAFIADVKANGLLEASIARAANGTEIERP